LSNQTFRNWLSEVGFTHTGLPHATVSSQFLACVSREENAKKLRRAFQDALGELGQSVEILNGRNVDGVKNADVVLLW
jgi:pyrroline-5-carboxylate reductase